jgi:UDP-N-acetylglucosamine 3-dehydrogenase
MVISVVGTGWWGRNIVKTLQDDEQVSKIVVFDSYPDAYKNLRDDRKLMKAGSFEEILNDPSVAGVCLATSPPTHFELSRRILQAGKHLLVEKPPAPSPLQVRELGQIARDRRLVYMLDAVFLFHEPLRKLKTMIDDLELKDLRYVQLIRVGDEMRRAGVGLETLLSRHVANGVDVLEDLFFHDAGILLYLFGEFEYVSSEKLHLLHPTICDTVRIKLHTRGVPAEIFLSWTLAGRRRSVVVYDRDFLVEYDALRLENQISKYHLLTNENEQFTITGKAPLARLLDFFIRCIERKEVNHLGAEFMERITSTWRAIADEHR